MLYHFLYPLQEYFGALNVFRYITFRTGLAVLTALAISFILGPWLIRSLSSRKVGQAIRDDGPASHFKKAGTPTMGGTMILIAVIVSVLLCGRLDSPYVWLVMLIIVSYGAIGFIDDYRKIRLGNAKGIPGKAKLVGQFAVAGVVAGVLYGTLDFDTTLTLPFFKKISPDLGWLFIPFVMLVIVGTSNAVNLTDGLDGLAIGPVMTTAGTFAAIAYIAGRVDTAEYLAIPYVAGSGNLTILCGAILGAGLGFLWFNTYPASVFMGDVGSLPLGGALGTIAVITKEEILLAIVGGIFAIEALSVIVQVISFRMTGRRIFQMAPIHHHYELKGWPEPKIIVRFWIVSIILSLLALGTLKLR